MHGQQNIKSANNIPRWMVSKPRQ